MQDEVNEKVVSLCIRGGKISAQILKSALLKTLTKLEQQKSQRKQKKGVSKEEKIWQFIKENKAWRNSRSRTVNFPTLRLQTEILNPLKSMPENIMWTIA